MMSDDNNIKKYSAADIEKYWKGKLSSAEMHSLEKAAMDDPFLADALEGYRNTTNTLADIDLLNQKLNERTGKIGKVAPLPSRKFPWLRVAAAVVIIGGLAVLAQQLFFNNSKNEIASAERKDEQKVAGETKTTDKPVSADSNKTYDVSTVTSEPENAGQGIQKTKIVNATTGAISKSDSLNIEYTNTQPASSAPVTTTTNPVTLNPKTAEDKAELKKEGDIAAEKLNDEKTNNPLYKEQAERRSLDKNASFAKDKVNFGLANAQLYKGRVLDAQNNPVPFANVVNSRDQVGTYSDVSGNFNLISTDSTLDVQLRALGFETRNQRLLPSKTVFEIVMQEDRKARNEVLASNRKVVSSRAREEDRELEEPEVGWGYYNIYVANNINIPDKIRSKNTGTEVELSFQVDKNGQPTNIKVTKSSKCRECDEEAIRLLKEGPKWKRKGKKSKTTVSIAVDK